MTWKRQDEARAFALPLYSSVELCDGRTTVLTRLSVVRKDGRVLRTASLQVCQTKDLSMNVSTFRTRVLRQLLCVPMLAVLDSQGPSHTMSGMRAGVALYPRDYDLF